MAEIWRKNIDAMKESERTRTMKGSLWKIVGDEKKLDGKKMTRTL